MPSRLARTLQLAIRGQSINVRTPLLIPSFSSKELVDISKAFDVIQPSITESFLISAHDISYGSIEALTFTGCEILHAWNWPLRRSITRFRFAPGPTAP